MPLSTRLARLSVLALALPCALAPAVRAQPAAARVQAASAQVAFPAEADAIARAGLAPGEIDNLVAVATPCVSGRADTYACNGIDLQARLPLSSFGPTAPTSANEVWGWTDPQTRKEIALVGLSNGVGFVDVSRPDAPVYLGKLASHTAGNNNWRTFRVYRNFLYVGSEAAGHGIQIFNLERLRGVTAATAFTADARYTGTTAQPVSNTHTLVINEQTGFLYVVGTRNSGSCGNGGPHMVDIRAPLAPVFAGCITTDGYTHEAEALVYDGPDATYRGRELLVMYQGTGSATIGGQVSFFDVTDKAAPRRISTAFYPNPGYSHQGWFTADRRQILINDEFDQSPQGARTVVLNVADLDAPEFAFNYFAPIATYAHNLYVIGRYAYTSNYTSGLRIVDTQTSGAFREVASFDTYPQNDGRAYNGQWMNYPYFASGNVVATDIQNGFFVLRPTGIATADEGAAPTATSGLALSAPAPNPTTSEARLRLTVDAPQRVRAVLVDVLGREAAVLFDGTADRSTDLVVRRGSLPSGTYVVRVTGERGAASRTLIVAR